MEVWAFVVGIISVLLAAAGLLAAGVWCVSRITASVDKLGEKVDGLGKRVGDLAVSVHDLDDKLDSHAERIARLEERGKP